MEHNRQTLPHSSAKAVLPSKVRKVCSCVKDWDSWLLGLWCPKEKAYATSLWYDHFTILLLSHAQILHDACSNQLFPLLQYGAYWFTQAFHIDLFLAPREEYPVLSSTFGQISHGHRQEFNYDKLETKSPEKTWLGEGFCGSFLVWRAPDYSLWVGLHPFGRCVGWTLTDIGRRDTGVPLKRTAQAIFRYSSLLGRVI